MKLKCAVLLAGMCLVLTGCGASQAEVQPEEKAILVAAQAAEIKSVRNELPYPGQVKASESVAVISKISGKVAEVFFDTGDMVKAGDVLFTMDRNDIENNIKALEAQLVTVNAGVRAAQTGVSQAGAGAAQAAQVIAQRELVLSQAQLGYDNALKNYNNAELLYEMGDISQNELDQIKTALNNAEIAVSQAKSGLEQTKSGYSEGQRRAQDALAQATAQRDSVLVSLETARELLEDASIKAPIDGVVGSRSVDPHMMLGASMVPFTIVQTDVVEVRAQVTETLINSLSEGDTVPVSISAAGSGQFEGKITTLSPAANEMSSTFEVCVSVQNSGNAIKPGMYAEVSFTKEYAENAVVIPRSAVIVENGELVVYTAQGDRAKRNIVETGVDNGIEIEITAGISSEDMVIVRGQSYIKDGSLIKIDESRGDAG